MSNTTGTAPTLHSIFAACCATKTYRYTLERPWVAGGNTYATDGRIVVRQASAAPDTIPEPRHGGFPPVLDLPWDKPYLPVPMPIVPPERQPEKCGECGGEGCGDCDFEGEAGPDPVRLMLADGRSGIGDNYARLLERHGAALFVRADGWERLWPVYFVVPAVEPGAAKIEGLLMTMGPYS